MIKSLSLIEPICLSSLSSCQPSTCKPDICSPSARVTWDLILREHQDVSHCVAALLSDQFWGQLLPTACRSYAAPPVSQLPSSFRGHLPIFLHLRQWYHFLQRPQSVRCALRSPGLHHAVGPEPQRHYRPACGLDVRKFPQARHFDSKSKRPECGSGERLRCDSEPPTPRPLQQPTHSAGLGRLCRFEGAERAVALWQPDRPDQPWGFGQPSQSPEALPLWEPTSCFPVRALLGTRWTTKFDLARFVIQQAP